MAPYLEGRFYVRVSFEMGDERGCPRPGPAPEADHLAAYKPFLYSTKEAALEALLEARGAKTVVAPETLYEPSGDVPEYDGPLEPEKAPA